MQNISRDNVSANVVDSASGAMTPTLHPRRHDHHIHSIMTSRRTLKVAEAIRETVAVQILFGLKDPRVKNVTVLGVKASGDLRHAKVYVSVMGDEKTQALTMHGLHSARGFLQSKIADELNLRYTPILEFVLDQGVKKSIETSEILREVLPEDDEQDTLQQSETDDLPETPLADPEQA